MPAQIAARVARDIEKPRQLRFEHDFRGDVRIDETTHRKRWSVAVAQPVVASGGRANTELFEDSEAFRGPLAARVTEMPQRAVRHLPADRAIVENFPPHDLRIARGKDVPVSMQLQVEPEVLQLTQILERHVAELVAAMNARRLTERQRKPISLLEGEGLAQHQQLVERPILGVAAGAPVERELGQIERLELSGKEVTGVDVENRRLVFTVIAAHINRGRQSQLLQKGRLTRERAHPAIIDREHDRVGRVAPGGGLVERDHRITEALECLEAPPENRLTHEQRRVENVLVCDRDGVITQNAQTGSGDPARQREDAQSPQHLENDGLHAAFDSARAQAMTWWRGHTKPKWIGRYLPSS